MAERTNEIEKTESKGIKRKNSEPEDTAGSSKIAKTEPEPKPEQSGKKEIAEETEQEPTPVQTDNEEEDSETDSETENEPEETEKPPTIEELAKHFRTKVQETVAELINPTNDDFDGPETLRRLEFYVFMARAKALKAGIPCSFEFKINLD